MQQVWNRLGHKDPLWAVLTDARYKDGGWDPEALLTVGVAEVERILTTAQDRQLTFGRQSALDFGCGVGRLSQALAPSFASVVGVDIAPSMIAEAERLNKWGSKIRFMVNDRPDLAIFDDNSFDLVVTLLVLQHIEPRYSRNYIGEFVRVMKPGGLLIFQVPAGPPDQQQSATRDLKLPDGAYHAELSCMSSAVAATPGSSMTITVTARNPTPYTWPPHVEALGVGIGNHWLSAGGVEIQRDDGRSYLRTDVASGQAASLDLVVNAPSTPGRYLLEFDMVHEGVTWFAQKGSIPLRLPVRVRSRRRLPWQPAAHQPEADAGTTRMEMHAIPTSEITTVVEAGGGRVAWVDSQQVPGYTDCTYYVTKAGASA